MQLKQILYSGIAYTIIAFVINEVEAMFTMSYYTNPAYYGIWSKLMMSSAGPPTLTFFIVSILFSLISGIIFAWFYSMVSESIPGKGTRRGLNYGLALFVVVGIPFTLTIYLLLAVPTMLLIYWAIASLIVYILSGFTFSKIMK